MRFQVGDQLMQGWIAGCESLAEQPDYHTLCLWIDTPDSKPITEYVFWKMYLIAWVPFRYTICSSLGFTALIAGWFYTSVPKLRGINWSDVDIWFLCLTQRSLVSFIWWQPWSKSWPPHELYILSLLTDLTWKFSKENQKAFATNIIKILQL